MSEAHTADQQPLDTAIEIAGTLANQPADSSLSFMLDERGQQAAKQALNLLEENYPSNFTNMKAAVLDMFEAFSSSPPRTPLNVHLEEDDIKALEYAVEVLERERD